MLQFFNTYGDLMTNYRMFVEKKSKFNIEASQLLVDLKQNLHLNNLSSLRLINIYDLFNITSADLELVKNTVLAELPVDLITDTTPELGRCWFAVEPLPGQYDQRADSAIQAFNLLSINNPNLSITTGKLIITNPELTDDELAKIKNYYINPLEYREKNLNEIKPVFIDNQPVAVPRYSGFNQFDEAALNGFRASHGLAMTLADLQCVQDYFKNQAGRDPSETEIKVLDTYWSDHCRHTTFETHLIDIQFASGKYSKLYQETYNQYLLSREYVHANKINNKPVTLMDLATICGKQFKKAGKLDDLELSDEINACSILVDIEIDGKPQKWSLQFKNETHNHPTEIEPYGGASTCVGGAIRDPLSGRSYVYQAMRVSGAANPLEAIEDTLPGKLPQKKITAKAAHGFSSYGNQIGLATTHVREIYHPGYKAKRMEVGMVVAAAPYANIRRDQPEAGDVIILLGGRTGRDGCGGATGSSKEHTIDSAALCGAEVQKGNPVIERKIQRLFRNPEVTRLIKKCNDFGAGGVSVAIGELAAGVAINLDKVPTKYHGLTGTELAISESQERMAVVIARNDMAKFIELANAENLEATFVAEVTREPRMTMTWRGDMIVNLERSFLDTNGAKSEAKIIVTANESNDLFKQESVADTLADQLKAMLANLNVCSQQGMVDMFDATIGATTVLMPFGGKYQLTPAQVSVQKFPLIDGQTDAASIASFGYDPYLSSKSTFHGAYYAVYESVAKIVAAGGDYQKIRFSFQEYFEKLGTDPHKWAKPFNALLGAYKAQQELELAAIGGKDSMSGTFNEINVPPTLISFAVAPTLASRIISPEFKAAGNHIYAYLPSYDENNVLEAKETLNAYKLIQNLIATGTINGAMAIGFAGILEAISKMSFGNKLGFELADGLESLGLFNSYYGGLVFATSEKLSSSEFIFLGNVIAEPLAKSGGEVIALDELIAIWQCTLNPVFPITKPVSDANFASDFSVGLQGTTSRVKPRQSVAKPRVVIAVFPGTNCEYDSKRAFDFAGAISDIMVFNNLSPSHINQSIDRLVSLINNSQILMLPGGFSAGDEPDGSAKFIATILRNTQVRDAVHGLLARDGLILGICNGFQALIKSGLLPFGEIADLTEDNPTLTYNVIGRHISRLSATKIVSNQSPWLSSFNVGEIKQIAMSHGEGRLVISPELAKELAANGQIACQYVDLDGQPTLDGIYNPNGSDYAIEALTSSDGRILGKMGHSERKGENLYKNIVGDKNQDIFANGVLYFN